MLRIPIPFHLLLGCAIALQACEPSAPEEDNARFRPLSAAESGVTFANKLDETEYWNIIAYLYFYNGGGLAVGDVNNDGLPDLFFTANTGPNALYINQGGLKFEEVTEQAGLIGQGNWKTGAVMVDINGDGWLDIYVCQVGNYKSRQGQNELYINNQDGTFTERAAAYGLDFRGFSTHAAFFDYDGDGDLDCYLLNHSVHSPENYVDARIRLQTDSMSGDRLLRNDGGRFVDVTTQAGLYSSRIGFGLSVAVSDINNDGWPDLYISNDFHENDYLYLNNGDATFRDATTQALSYNSTFSMGSDIADFNNDGWTDIISLDMKPEEESVLKTSIGADPYNIYQFKLSFGYHYQFPRNMLHLNQGVLNGQPRFSEIAQLAGVAATDWSWTALFADLDHDGQKDLFVGNGIWRRPNDLDYLNFVSKEQVWVAGNALEMARKMPSGQMPNYAFRNSGGLQFEDVSQTWGLAHLGCTNAAVFVDLDLDGDLDLVTNNTNAPALIFENRSDSLPASIQLALRDAGANTAGIGSRVEIYADGQRQVQELFCSRGFQSSTPAVLHFGLGNATKADSVHIRWPDGRWQRLGPLAAGRHTVERAATLPAFSPAQVSVPPRFQALEAASLGIGYAHQENRYNDFDREPLMPHLLSTQGPAAATAQLNGQALLYLGGAKGQRGGLWLETEGQFAPFSPSAFEGDELYEDTDAAFFDSNGDGQQELVVLSGGGETDSGPSLALRLYRLNRQGQFERVPGALAGINVNGGCLLPVDYDQDGKLDLFIGARSVPGAYGLPGPAYLLKNKGGGQFEQVTAAEMPALASMGMITDAAYLPEAHQLVIVGEWMPVSLLDLKTGQLSEAWPHSSGWWNTVTVTDLDGDGRSDLLLGNLGLNSNLQASPKMPLELYVKDLDDNGQAEPILTYYRQGQQYTLASKDELAEQWIDIKKRYPDYATFAGHDFSTVMKGGLMDGAYYRQAAQLASGYALQSADGQFHFYAFPARAQISPLFAFLPTASEGGSPPQLLAGGNWHGQRPSIGRYEASLGLALAPTDEGWTVLPPAQSGFFVPGECRALKGLKLSTGRYLVLAVRNDAPPLLFEYTDN